MAVALNELQLQRRSGLARRAGAWWSDLGHMMTYELLSQKPAIVGMLLLQVAAGVGLAVIYAFYLGNITHTQAEYIATGAPVLALVPQALSILPQVISRQKMQGTYDFIWSLPVARSAATTATILVYALADLPGAAVTTVLASLIYGAGLHPTVTLLPAAVLVTAMASSVGLGIGQAVKNPLVVGSVSNAITFGSIFFTPIAFPAGQYPHWLVSIEVWLPIYPMAEVIRSALQPSLVSTASVHHAYLVLGGWTVVSWIVTAWIVARRK